MTLRGWTLSPVIAAVVAVLAGYSGSIVIVFQAAAAANLTAGQLSSWIWAISLGCGVCAITLSLVYRAPISVAWSTPGAALLVVSLPGVAYADAIGAFIVSAAIIVVLAVTGLFDRVMRLVPPGIASGMLAGILFRFGADTFVSLGHQPLLVAVMIAVYLAARRLVPRFAISLVLLAGIVLSSLRGQTDFSQVHLALAVPELTWPHLSLFATVNLAIPLTLVAITGQYLPGLTVLRGAGFTVPARPIVGVISTVSMLFAPFGNHGIATAAITAALIAGPEAHEAPAERWRAGVAMGVCYLLVGLFGATLAALFASLPRELIAAVAGLAFLGAILGGLTTALAAPRERDAALITFLCTASGMSLFGLGAAFWGLVIGLAAQFAFTVRKPA